jgi:hypothetical protein
VRILDTIYPYKKNLKLKPILDVKGRESADAGRSKQPSCARLLDWLFYSCSLRKIIIAERGRSPGSNNHFDFESSAFPIWYSGHVPFWNSGKSFFYSLSTFLHKSSSQCELLPWPDPLLPNSSAGKCAHINSPKLAERFCNGPNEHRLKGRMV